MSGSTYDSHETYRSKSYASAESDEERERLLNERRLRVEESRSSVGTKSTKPRDIRDARELYDKNLVHKTVTRPAPDVKRVYVILIDNSGSNRKIANHFRNSTNYLRVNLGLLDPEAQFVFAYVSDHCDRNMYWQPIDYLYANEEGERILTSTLFHVEEADGGDAPEAFECTLWDACKLDFGDVKERHLILVTDVVGHGMGLGRDEGCTQQRDWRDTLDLVEKTFTTFEVIGCGDEPHVAKLQEQFIAHAHPENLAMNFISLAYIKEHQHRLGIVLNAFLLLVARHRGLQSLEGFLSRLYEKWIDDPIFGKHTDIRAREAIVRFGKYIPIQSSELAQMMSRVLSISTAEVEELVKQNAVHI